MIKLLTIVGARPQIIKASALSRAIGNQYSGIIEEKIIHTGQHYDFNMSEIFFREMDIPIPAYNLQIGSDSHGRQTALMISGIEQLLEKEKPDWCVLFGDTNSTLAGAVAAAKIQIPIIHIEAGLRSYDKTMPEELNRICCDHFSTLLFAPTKTAIRNLQREGFNTQSSPKYTIDNPGIFLSGDIMFDNTLFFRQKAAQNSEIIQQLKLFDRKFVLCTVHRSHNTDNPDRLLRIIQTLYEISVKQKMTVVLPLHPRTRKLLYGQFSKEKIENICRDEHLLITEPVSFLDMIQLESSAELIITDSGGVQKEAYFMEKPCVILRNTTEWTEIIEQGAGILTDDNEEKIMKAVQHFIQHPLMQFPDVFGDGHAAEYICKTIYEHTR